MRIFDVEKLPTHGGSLRLFLCHHGATHNQTSSVNEILLDEKEAGLLNLSTYTAFADRVIAIKLELVKFVIDVKEKGKSIAAYGAAAKGNTLLNYCGIGADFIDCVADKNPTKQNRLLPGTRIPVVSPEYIYELQPDYLLILPWNIKNEVIQQMSGIRDWGGKFVVPIPNVEIIS